MPVVAPRALLPAEIERLGVEVFQDMAEGLADLDIVGMLRLQSERTHGFFVPSTREYFHFFGLDYDKLRSAEPDALIMHPGPMNRVEIGSQVVTASLVKSAVVGQAPHPAASRVPPAPRLRGEGRAEGRRRAPSPASLRSAPSPAMRERGSKAGRARPLSCTAGEGGASPQGWVGEGNFINGLRLLFSWQGRHRRLL